LFLGLTGNLEANFNKLEIFIDSQAGGENTLSGLPGNDDANRMAGLTFDSGFTADYHLIVRRGFDGFGGFGDGKFDVDFAALGGVGTFDFYEDIFNDGSMPNGGGVEGSGMTGTGINASPIEFAYDNSNIAGVGGGNGALADQSAAAAVQTGLEMSIDLADIGSPTGDFRVMAFVNGGGHDFASNQFLGGVPVGTGNLGGDGAGNFTCVVNFDLNQFAGDQFFTVPEPASIALLALGALALVRRR